MSDKRADTSQLARERTDASLAQEREHVDADIELSPTRAQALRQALERSRNYEREREATDADLSTERQVSTWLLSLERAAHEETKATLTTRDEFLAIVSHDLRSPLSAILHGTEMLNSNRAVEGSENAGRTVEGIRRNAAGMLRMIDDLLDVERLAVGKLELVTRDHDLRKLVSNVMEMFASRAQEKALSLSVDLPEAPVVVSCDGDRVMQVLTNLVSNAVKFTSRGGAVVISVCRGENSGLVSVGDTGPGIPVEARGKIFERFSQLPSGNRTGLGLGLFIAKSIICAHEGKLWVASAVGEGSVFSFALRLADH